MVHKKRVSLTALLGVSVEILNKVVPLVVMLVAQRRLGLEGFGYALFGVTFVELVSPLIVYGYNHLGAVAIAGKKNDTHLISFWISNITALRILHTIALIIATAALTYFSNYYQRYQPLFFAVSFSFFFTAIETIWVHVAIQKMARVSIFIATARFSSMILILCLIHSPKDAILFAILTLFSNALISLLTFIVSTKNYPLLAPKLSDMKNCFIKAHVYAFVLFLTTYLEKIDVILAEAFYNLQGAGLYAGPARIGHSLFQIINAIAIAFFSEVIAVNDKKNLTSYLKLSLWAILSFASPIVVGSYFVDEDILQLIFSSTYRETGKLLTIITANTLIAVLISVFGMQILMVRNEVKKFALYLFVGAILATSLSFSSRYFTASLSAIAFSMSAGKVVCLFLLIRASLPFIESFPWQTILRGLLPSLGMGALLLFLQPNGLPNIVGLGFVIYSILFALFNFNSLKRNLASLWK